MKFIQVTLTLLAVLLTGTGCSITAPEGATASRPATDLFMISVEAQRAYRESRWNDALRHYQLLVEKLPADSSAWFHLANTYARQGEFEPAIHAYEQSLRFDQAQPKAWFNLSSVYLQNARSAMARASALMDPVEPSRLMIEERLQVLDGLLKP